MTRRVSVLTCPTVPELLGMTVERLADVAAVLGVDGPAESMIAFALEVQRAAIASLNAH